MCGILTQYSKHSTIDVNLFNEALALLNHRGPDEHGRSALLNDGHLLLGHTRLSIIGLNNGRQPISTLDNSLTAIINGEFYDYKQIRNELALQGYKFKTDSDSEIIFPLYQKYKYKAFTHLNGEFAGIIYDSNEKKLVVFRDRHGVKPLYFKNTLDNFIISSEIKPILKIDNIQPEWNVDYLKQMFCRMHAQNQTVYKDIYQVKPGCYMVFDLLSDSITEHQYWQIDFNHKNYLQTSLADLTKQYESEFVQAVSRRLVADVPVATYLSGGIDSSACYGVASSIVGKGVDAFTVSFDNPDYDEFNLAQKLVKKYDGKHHVLNVTEPLLFEHFEKHLWYVESPIYNLNSVAKYLLSDMVHASGFKVVITGEGSDEYNAGYPPLVIDALKHEHHNTSGLSDKLLNVSFGSMINAEAKELTYAKDIFGFSPTWFENSAIAATALNHMYASKYQDINPHSNIQRWLRERYTPEMKNWGVLNTSLFLISQVTFSYVLSVLGDRTEMAHSVEARLPFLDCKLVEFLAKVPPQFKVNETMDKFLLREAVKKYVTSEHYQTAKHPYTAPPIIRKNSLFTNYMYDVFSSSWFNDIGLFDQEKVLGFLAKVINSDKAIPKFEMGLFWILSFAVMHKMFGFRNL